LAQLLSFLYLKQVISPSGIITQLPLEVREKLFVIESFQAHFGKIITKLSEEKDYRLRAQTLIQQFYSNFDSSELAEFLSKEIKQKGWEIFNYLFIRKAIDIAMDKNANEKEACSKLLQDLTQKYNF
jgi:hypothetical protein